MIPEYKGMLSQLSSLKERTIFPSYPREGVGLLGSLIFMWMVERGFLQAYGFTSIRKYLLPLVGFFVCVCIPLTFFSFLGTN